MAVRRSIRFVEIPDLPAVLHQPSGFLFPKRLFIDHFRGLCEEWPFLHYDGAKDATYFHTCATAVKVMLLHFAFSWYYIASYDISERLYIRYIPFFCLYYS